MVKYRHYRYYPALIPSTWYSRCYRNSPSGRSNSKKTKTGFTTMTTMTTTMARLVGSTTTSSFDRNRPNRHESVSQEAAGSRTAVRMWQAINEPTCAAKSPFRARGSITREDIRRRQQVKGEAGWHSATKICTGHLLRVVALHASYLDGVALPQCIMGTRPRHDRKHACRRDTKGTCQCAHQPGACTWCTAHVRKQSPKNWDDHRVCAREAAHFFSAWLHCHPYSHFLRYRPRLRHSSAQTMKLAPPCREPSSFVFLRILVNTRVRLFAAARRSHQISGQSIRDTTEAHTGCVSGPRRVASSQGLSKLLRPAPNRCTGRCRKKIQLRTRKARLRTPRPE